MGDLVITVSPDLALPVIMLLLVIIASYVGIKIRRLPHDVANGLARGIARIAKANPKDENYWEAYTQLSTSIESAWETKDPSYLLPLIGNPIVHKAWQYVRGGLTKGLQQAEGGAEDSFA